MLQYPTINFVGNKEKLITWICQYIPPHVNSIFDAFSGGGAVSYAAKQLGKQVFSNDLLKINYYLAKALVENNKVTLNANDVAKIFSGEPIMGFMYKHFSYVYYYPQECQQLDQYRNNIMNFSNPYKKALAFSIMRRAMIRKMPYSRFNIPWNKIVQLRDENYSYAHYRRKRSYHNQTFREHFLQALQSYNLAVFNNGKSSKAYNLDIFSAIDKIEADLIYLDPPYAGTMNNYFSFYGLLDCWILNKGIPPFKNDFTNRKNISELLNNLFEKSRKYQYLLLSYNNMSFPSKDVIYTLLKNHYKTINIVEKKHDYKVTGILNKKKNTEYLFIANN